MGWPTLKVRLIYLLTKLFELRQWPHALSVETALSPRGLGPKRGILSRLWHLINPVPLRPIASTCLPPVPLYVPMVPNYLYSLCITTDQWALCQVCLLFIQLLNVFLFMIPVTNCSHPVILTNTIHLGESAMNITKLTHSTARTALIDGLPNSPSIAPYMLQ